MAIINTGGGGGGGISAVTASGGLVATQTGSAVDITPPPQWAINGHGHLTITSDDTSAFGDILRLNAATGGDTNVQTFLNLRVGAVSIHGLNADGSYGLCVSPTGADVEGQLGAVGQFRTIFTKDDGAGHPEVAFFGGPGAVQQTLVPGSATPAQIADALGNASGYGLTKTS